MTIRCRFLLPVLLAGLHPEGGLHADEPAARRDPFWPIGYQPAAPVEPEEAPPPATAVASLPQPVTETQWQEAERAVGLRPARYSVGERADGQAFLLIGGGLRSTGEEMAFRRGSLRFSWRIVSIARNEVLFERLTAEEIATDTPPTGPR